MTSRLIFQAAAIPVCEGRVCLVTSSSGRRWVIPKGRIDPGYTPEKAALAEAWEEAGLIGHLLNDSPGHYEYEKFGLVHQVVVFVMKVTEQKLNWPEQSMRKREWVPLDVAITRMEEPKLQEIMRSVFKRSENMVNHVPS